MDRLTAMRVFAEVATSGSFSATADKLDMSRAMVTRYVAEMEQWLQARLLQRTTRSVTLTDAGELALRRCQQMLALSEDLEEETATTAEGELRGQLRLTCSVSFAFAQMGAAIADLSSGNAAVYAPISAIVKVLIALPFVFVNKKSEKILTPLTICLTIPSGVITVLGYYLGDLIVNKAYAVANIPMNIVQAVGSAIIFVVISAAFDAAKLKKKLFINKK